MATTYTQLSSQAYKNLFLVRDHRPMEQLQKAKDGYTNKIYVHEQNLWPIEVQKGFILNRIVIHEGSKQNLPYCTPEEQWRQDDKLAIMSKFQKKAHKLVDTPEQSIEWIEKINGNVIPKVKLLVLKIGTVKLGLKIGPVRSQDVKITVLPNLIVLSTGT